MLKTMYLPNGIETRLTPIAALISMFSAQPLTSKELLHAGRIEALECALAAYSEACDKAELDDSLSLLLGVVIVNHGEGNWCCLGELESVAMPVYGVVLPSSKPTVSLFPFKVLVLDRAWLLANADVEPIDGILAFDNVVNEVASRVVQRR